MTDQTATLTSEQRATLEQTLTAFEARKGSQLAVLIVGSSAPEEIEQFALRVAEQRKLGRKKVDDGAILVVAKTDRAVHRGRVRPGRGAQRSHQQAHHQRDDPATAQGAGLLRRHRGRSRSDHLRGRRRALAGTERGPAVGIGDVQQYAPVLIIVALAVGGVLRAVLGRVPGAVVTGGVVAAIAWFVVGAVSMALVAGLIALFVTLLGGAGCSAPGRLGVTTEEGAEGVRGRWIQRRWWWLWRRRRVGEVVTMKIERIARHLFTSQASRAGPPPQHAGRDRDGDQGRRDRTAGEIRFAVEGAFDGTPLFRDSRPASGRSRSSRDFACGTPSTTTAC